VKIVRTITILISTSTHNKLKHSPGTIAFWHIPFCLMFVDRWKKHRHGSATLSCSLSYFWICLWEELPALILSVETIFRLISFLARVPLLIRFHSIPL